jgi:L,D-peptidoglycan transpeptidase YkuD (ErfK/YbiS/YcfS/YnhG family)
MAFAGRDKQNSRMDLVVERSTAMSLGVARWGSRTMRCALGRTGVHAEKHEGDGATPAGAFPMRFVLYRPDREAAPRTGLRVQPIAPEDGWCDAPADPAYNRMVRLPYPASAETMWRADGLYDLVVPLGYNDEPVVKGRGSAIFLHLAAANFAPTAGCVALAHADMLAVLRDADSRSRVIIR